MARDLTNGGVLPPRVRVVAVDERVVGAAGTRLVDGIEELADFLHPATDQALAEREATGAPTRAAINDALVRQD